MSLNKKDSLISYCSKHSLNFEKTKERISKSCFQTELFISALRLYRLFFSIFVCMINVILYVTYTIINNDSCIICKKQHFLTVHKRRDKNFTKFWKGREHIKTDAPRFLYGQVMYPRFRYG